MSAPDTFARVAQALRDRWISAPDAIWRDDVARQRNLLLDACGSDHRALVELLLSTGELVQSALRSDTPDARWDTRRAPIVHKLVSTRYLQPDVARWIVDCWAYAIDVRAELPESPAMQFIDARDANTGVGRSAASATQAGMATATAGTRTSAWRRGVTGTTASSGMLGPLAGSHTGLAHGQPLHGAATHSAGRVGMGRGRMTPAELARIKRMERVSLITLAGALVFGFVAHGYALWSKPLERAGTGTAGGGTATAVGATATAVGVVTTDAVSAVPPTAVSAVPPTAVAVPAPPASPPTLTGRYVVTHRNVNVIGGDGCDDVARALARREPSIESINANAAAASIHLVDRGVTGRLERDGRFVTGPDSGVTDGVRWTFRMVGRFTDTGFVASTQKTTAAIIGWHKSRSCSVVAELTGHRLAR